MCTSATHTHTHIHTHIHTQMFFRTFYGLFALRIPGTGEPGGLPSMGLHRVGHDRSDLAAAAAD